VRAWSLLLLALAGCGSHGDHPGFPSGPPNDNYDTPSPSGNDGPCSLGQFGACVADGECGPDQGHLSSVACDGQATVCCAPVDRCTGSEDFVCCDADGAEHRPVCDVAAGQPAAPLACPYGQTRAAAGRCSPNDAGKCLQRGAVCDPSAPACCPGTTCAPAHVPDDGGAPSPPECA
jgi:hypothetical protein